MVNRTRIEGGGYSKRDIISWYDQQAGCNIIVDVLLYNRLLCVASRFQF